MKKAVFAAASIIVLCIVFASSMAIAASNYDQAMDAYRHGNYKQSAALLETYLKDHPSAEGYYLLGYSYYKLGRKKDAMTNFNQSYLIDPEFKPETLNKELNTGGK